MYNLTRYTHAVLSQDALPLVIRAFALHVQVLTSQVSGSCLPLKFCKLYNNSFLNEIGINILQALCTLEICMASSPSHALSGPLLLGSQT